MIETNTVDLNTEIPAELKGMRLDQALAKCFPEHSRARLTQWLKEGLVKVNNEILAPKTKIQGQEQIKILVSITPNERDLPEDIPLDILFEDESLMVLNKPHGLVVHPGAGNRQGTLLNALLHHAPELQYIPRAGIIHRLDKDTSGLMVITKTLAAHTFLVDALAQRAIKREYVALVQETMIAGKTIDKPIGRHPFTRTKMAVTRDGKPAVTHIRCQKRYKDFTLLDVRLETGRTHQIRVHCAHEGYPLVGDALYGWRLRFPERASQRLQATLSAFKRQALHAVRLSLTHPVTGESLTWAAPLPEDFEELLAVLVM
jgi:23S rRNA pseudouridine1911/1915/1917 synthase